jgi:Type III restriction enzyme, res subunit
LEGFARRALDSWNKGFNYVREDPVNQVPGLRNPQIGAVHAILGHWSVSDEVGTIVMPTGTGKTETMLSLLLAVPCQKVLVVVPTDALRTQISEKFLTLGILKLAKVAGAETLYPVVGVVNGSSLEGNLFTPLNSEYPPFDRSRIEVIDWANVDMKNESMGMTKDPKSIQYRVVQHILATQDRDIAFDDDYSGEIADVVAIKPKVEGTERVIEVDLYHCKYALKGEPRALVDDLYQVCGQAQKCVSWCYPDKQVDFFSHLLRREPKRYQGDETTRFYKGTKKELLEVREMSKTGFMRARVFIVQPGLSKKDASDSQLALLAVTDNYLAETSKVEFRVIASA